MIPAVQRLCGLLAALLVMGAQVCGLQRGFICDHGEHPVETWASHCESNEGAPDEHDEERPHEALKLAFHCLKAGETGGRSVVFALIHPPSGHVLPLPTQVALPVWCLPQTEADPPDSLAVQVARCVVILV